AVPCKVLQRRADLNTGLRPQGHGTRRRRRRCPYLCVGGRRLRAPAAARKHPLPKSSFLKAQFCCVEIFHRFHQAAIAPLAISGWEPTPEQLARGTRELVQRLISDEGARFWSCSWPILRA
ncbi:unnamed protein product, partial [Laminaria digitata]